MTDVAKSRIYLVTIAVLLLVVAAMAYKFIVAGSTQKGEDGRVAVILEPGERALMLREMREFIAGLQRVADALSRDDMPGVAKTSRAMACCPTIRSRTRIDCWHGFNAATTVVSAHDRVGLGASPSTDRNRISAGREPAPEEATAWEAHSVHRRRASTSGAEGEGRRAQGFDETRHDSVSGYAVAVASAVRVAETELQPQARTRPARDHAGDL